MRLTAIVLVSLFVLSGCAEEEASFEYQMHTVKSGNLRIAIRQKGTIEARDPISVHNPIEGKSEILDIIPEGTFVEKGDYLFQLDVSSQEDKVLQQRIATTNAEQTLFNAQQQLEITKQQNESNIKKAELDVLFAGLDMKQYLEGDLPSEKESVEADITLSKEEEERAAETFSWSVKLAKKGYISNDKLEADKLLVKRREIERGLAKRKLEVLSKYTSKKRIRELESNLEESKRELERVKVRSRAAESQKSADVTARAAQFELEKKKLARLEHSVTNNRVMAPRSGLVIYAREGGRRDRKPLEAGSSVRKGQTILEIPDMDRVLVDIDVHESSVHLVQLGMPVIITTDTGETIVGSVESVATVADSQSWYRNPDLKVYSTKVTIDNPGRKLKPGMNCFAEVIIEDIKNVVSIPTQAVYDNGQKTFCYVNVDGKPTLREIEVGLHNTEAIHVKSGLKEGEQVYLAVPDDAEAIPLAKTRARKVDLSKARSHKPSAVKSGSAKKMAGARRGKKGKYTKAQIEAWKKKAAGKSAGATGGSHNPHASGDTE